MTESIKSAIKKYWKRELSKEAFLTIIQTEIGYGIADFRNYFAKIIQSRNANDLEYGLVILFAIEKDNNLTDLLNKLLLEPWHREYEELAHSLQGRKSPESIPFLKKAMQNKYEYLESYETGTRQFVNQCGHVLKSIGTDAAINVIKELSESDDPILKDEMLYRLSRIEGRNDYERNH